MLESILVIIFVSLTLLYTSWILIYFLPKRSKKERVHYPNLSVILPAHNEESVIEETINSILSANYPRNKEIIVVNDGSTDRTADIVKKISEEKKQVKLLNVKHGGKSKALNLGAKHAKYDTLVFLDADSSVDENSLKELIKPLSNEKVVAVSGIVRAKLTKNPLTWFQDFEYIMSSGWRYICNKINSTSVVPGFVLIKKQEFQKIGGFSNDTLTEDFDIVLDLRKSGYKTVMNSSAIIYTNVPNTIKGLFSQRIRWGRGNLQVIKKHSDMLFSKDYGLLGNYTIPTHIYWYIFSILYLPAILYWMLGDYYRYFFANNNIISWEVFLFFFKWFTSYGMFEVIYKTMVGTYQLNAVLLFTILAFTLSGFYNLLIYLKFTKPSVKHAIVYFFLFPYQVLVIFIQSIAFLYEIRNKSKNSNRWKKNE